MMIVETSKLETARPIRLDRDARLLDRATLNTKGDRAVVEQSFQRNLVAPSLDEDFAALVAAAGY